MAEYAKCQCLVWEKGKYKAIEKPEKKKLKGNGEEKMTSPEEYFGSTEDYLKRQKQTE